VVTVTVVVMSDVVVTVVVMSNVVVTVVGDVALRPALVSVCGEGWSYH
jgi:hypothetical protein